MELKTTYPEMTIEEIETQFDGEWVLVGNGEFDPYNKVTRGHVLCHSPNRDEVYDYVKIALVEGFRNLATLCNKDVPQGTAVLL